MYKQISSPGEIALAERFLKQGGYVSWRYNGKKYGSLKKDSVSLQLQSESFQDSSAVEWVAYLKNESDKNSGMFDEVLALDTELECGENVTLSYLRGTLARIDDFEFLEETVTNEKTIESVGSKQFSPFFNIELSKERGVIVALGWTGSWKLSLKKTGSRLKITAGMPKTHFYLEPGERVRTPRVCVMFWQGDKTRSFNMFRRHLVLEHIPKDKNREPFPPICCNTWGGMKTVNHLKLIDFIKEKGLKYDCYWIDAGWYGKDHETDEFQDLEDNDWFVHQGEWRVNRTVHSDTLKPVSEAAHSAGMKLLLWYDIYNCVENIGWHSEHPEWAGPLNGPHTYSTKRDPAYIVFLNVNYPGVREWMCKTLEDSLNENGADYYREDPPPIYGGEDTPDRIGICEMHAVETLYDFWDELRKNRPEMLIDNCGGGGTRIDLETLSRSYCLWRTDYNCAPESDPIGAQCANLGLGRFVPLVGGLPPIKPGDTYCFRSGLYGGMGFGMFHVCGHGKGQTFPADDYPTEWHRKMLDDYRAVKPFLSGDFYPLADCPTDDGGICAYRFERTDLKGGVIMFFRRQNNNEVSFSLKTGLCGSVTFRDTDSDKTFDLSSDNITLNIDTGSPRTSAMFIYTLND